MISHTPKESRLKLSFTVWKSETCANFLKAVTCPLIYIQDNLL